MQAIGKILKAQGLKGEVKIRCYFDTPQMLEEVKEVSVKGIKRSFEKMRFEGEFAYVLFSGVSTREEADLLRDAEILSEESALPPPPEGRVSGRDILGAEVYLCESEKFEEGYAVTAEDRIGELLYVDNYAGRDIFTLRAEKCEYAVPATDNLILDISIEPKVLVFDKKVFFETTVIS